MNIAIMKRFAIAIFASAVLFGCTIEIDFIVEPIEDDLLDVTFSVNTNSPDSKVWSGWYEDYNIMIWDNSDRIGIFAGDDNVNCPFTLNSEPDSNLGYFSGKMKQVVSPVTLYCYYPYSEKVTSVNSIIYPDMANQVYEGTFDEKGEFYNLSDYSILVARCSGFTLDSQWPDLNINLSPLFSLVRFKISNELDRSISVRTVGMVSENYSFVDMTEYDIGSGGFYGYYAGDISTEISSKNPLVIGKSETKYVQMASSFSQFDEETIYVYADCLDQSGRNVEYYVPKKVTSANNLDFGYRRTVTLPINNEAYSEYASRVKVTTSSDVSSFTAPVFNHGEYYQAADAVWGDSTIEKYEAGRTHKFSTSGEHTSSFNHWGYSTSLVFENLSGITAIDFSDVY